MFSRNEMYNHKVYARQVPATKKSCFFLALISIFGTPLFDPIPTHLKKQTRVPIQASLKKESSFPRHSHQNCVSSEKMSIFLCSNKLSRSLDLKKKKKKNAHQGENPLKWVSAKKPTSLLPETSVKFGCVTRHVQFSLCLASAQDTQDSSVTIFLDLFSQHQLGLCS